MSCGASRHWYAFCVLVFSLALGQTTLPALAQGEYGLASNSDGPREFLNDPPASVIDVRARAGTSAPGDQFFGPFHSVQVNVNSSGQNVTGDAANEPSIAISPLDPNKIVIGWRQFDTITSDFRQAGNAYSHDGGVTWTFPGVLDPGQFRSDPVLAADADGRFYYYSLSTITSVELFKSLDGGVTWLPPVNGFGGDKEWMAIDRTDGPGRGNIYTIWNVQFSCCAPADFTRSTNGGTSFETPIAVPQPSMKWGTLDVGPDGTLYLAGVGVFVSGHRFTRSVNAQNPNEAVVFDAVKQVDLGGTTLFQAGPNPAGLLGQVTIGTDHSSTSTSGNVYILGSVNTSGTNPLDVMFIRSTDGGSSWSAPVRVNDDAVHANAWHWFGTMSVAPNGRIDVIWNDTRNHLLANASVSELFYSFSHDGGITWSPNTQLSPSFNSRVGWPRQNKIGDYYDMISDDTGANLAYAATFNGEQDVYFLRIRSDDCNRNGVPDATDLQDITSVDCNANGVPDECEIDCNTNGIPDDCDILLGLDADCDGDIVPDSCELNFDGQDEIDDCDDDIDNDGVVNKLDQCVYSALGFPVMPNGRTIGDSGGECGVDLLDYGFLIECWFPFGGPGLAFGPLCADLFDHDGDLDLDLEDFSKMQNAFGQ